MIPHGQQLQLLSAVECSLHGVPVGADLLFREKFLNWYFLLSLFGPNVELGDQAQSFCHCEDCEWIHDSICKNHNISEIK